MDTTTKDQAIGIIKDLVTQTTAYRDPFLYYLPVLLMDPLFVELKPERVVLFVKEALNAERKPIVAEALLILNQLVDPEDGRLLTPTPVLFYEKHFFAWRELGGRVGVVNTIMHVLNKSLFTLSLGN